MKGSHYLWQNYTLQLYLKFIAEFQTDTYAFQREIDRKMKGLASQTMPNGYCLAVLMITIEYKFNDVQLSWLVWTLIHLDLHLVLTHLSLLPAIRHGPEVCDFGHKKRSGKRSWMLSK